MVDSLRLAYDVSGYELDRALYMLLKVNFSGGPECWDDVIALAKQYSESIGNLASGQEFESTLAEICVLPDVLNPVRGPANTVVTLDRSENSVSSYIEVPYAEFFEADKLGKNDLYAEAIKSAFSQIPRKHLPQADLDLILEYTEQARVALQRDSGNDVVNETTAGTRDVNTVEIIEESPAMQIVLQWLDDRPLPSDPVAHYSDTGEDDISTLEDTLEAHSKGLYEVDGHDFGSGTVNIFLDAVDPGMAVGRVVELAEADARVGSAHRFGRMGGRTSWAELLPG